VKKSKNENNYKILPVILAGGSGKRLWPLSRASFPKQYLNPIENNKYSLLQNTFLRLEGLENLEDCAPTYEIEYDYNGKDSGSNKHAEFLKGIQALLYSTSPSSTRTNNNNNNKKSKKRKSGASNDDSKPKKSRKG